MRIKNIEIEGNDNISKIRNIMLKKYNLVVESIDTLENGNKVLHLKNSIFPEYNIWNKIKFYNTKRDDKMYEKIIRKLVKDEIVNGIISIK